MTNRLPEGITNALNLLESSFGPVQPMDQARSFKNALYLLNDCTEEFPMYKENIRNIRYSYSVRLLCSLKKQFLAPDYESWLEFILLICIDLRREIKELRVLDSELFEYVLTLLGMFSKEIPLELQININRFIEELAQ